MLPDAVIFVVVTSPLAVNLPAMVLVPPIVSLPVIWRVEPEILPEADIFAATTVPVNVGEAENTNVPVPVSSVTAVAKFADDGVLKKVAIPVPNVWVATLFEEVSTNMVLDKAPTAKGVVIAKFLDIDILSFKLSYPNPPEPENLLLPIGVAQYKKSPLLAVTAACTIAAELPS